VPTIVLAHAEAAGKSPVRSRYDLSSLERATMGRRRPARPQVKEQMIALVGTDHHEYYGSRNEWVVSPTATETEVGLWRHRAARSGKVMLGDLACAGRGTWQPCPKEAPARCGFFFSPPRPATPFE